MHNNIAAAAALKIKYLCTYCRSHALLFQYNYHSKISKQHIQSPCPLPFWVHHVGRFSAVTQFSPHTIVNSLVLFSPHAIVNRPVLKPHLQSDTTHGPSYGEGITFISMCTCIYCILYAPQSNKWWSYVLKSLNSIVHASQALIYIRTYIYIHTTFIIFQSGSLRVIP